MDAEILIWDLIPEADGVFQGAQINEELVSETGVLEMWVISMQLS